MDQERAQQLGAYLLEKRTEAKLSTRALAEKVSAQQSTIVRLEQGKFEAPRGELLARVAQALGVPVNDVMALAGYPTSRALPNFRPYMRAKYRELPTDAIDEVERHIEQLRQKYGLSGPAPGEDE